MGLLRSAATFDPGLYRHAWVESDGDDLLVRVHTRNGQWPRDFAGAMDSMRAHPWFVAEMASEDDTHYIDVWFRPDPRRLSRAAFADLRRSSTVPPDEMVWSTLADLQARR